MRASWRAWLLVAGAFALGVAAFARSVAFGFVYDDHWTIEDGHLDVPLARLLTALSHGHAPDATRPAMAVSTWIDRALFGARPAGFHADSIALYGLVCALVALVCLSLTRRFRAAVAASVFFALAPLHTEVVCAINYREDLLAAIGVLVPLIFLLRKRAHEWLALVCFAVGLLAKESAVALVPCVGVIVAIVPRARASVLERRRLVQALLAVLVVWGVWRGGGLVRGDDVPRAHYPGVAAQLLASARFFVETAAAALVPLRAAPEHARQSPASVVWLVPLAAWVVAIVALARRRKTQVPAAGLAFAIVAAVAASPLFAPANEFADRYVFLGVAGGALVWGGLASRLPRRVFLPVVGAAGVALWVACQSSAAPWRNDRALWSEAVRVAPAAPRAWVGLSRACRIDGDLDEADRSAVHAIDLDPKFVAAHVTRAYDLLAREDVEGAHAELATIHALGGDRHRGVATVTRCAALPPRDAHVCITKSDSPPP